MGARVPTCRPSSVQFGKPISIRCVNGLEEFRTGSVVVEGVHLSQNMKDGEKIRENADMMSQQPDFLQYPMVPKNCALAPMLTIFKARAQQTVLRFLEELRFPDQTRKLPNQL